MDIEDQSTASSRPAVRWSARPKLTREAASRQGQVTMLALDALGGRDEAIAFLNAPSGPLGGRPLDLAIESAEGLNRVARALSKLRVDG